MIEFLLEEMCIAVVNISRTQVRKFDLLNNQSEEDQLFEKIDHPIIILIN